MPNGSRFHYKNLRINFLGVQPYTDPSIVDFHSCNTSSTQKQFNLTNDNISVTYYHAQTYN